MPRPTPLPAVSVLIRAPGEDRRLGMALDSLRAQSFPDWEALVMGGGEAAVAARRDPRFALLPAGPETRKAALAVARGEALLFLEAEDWLAPDALERLVLALEAAPAAVGAAGPFAFVAEDATPEAALWTHGGSPPEGDCLERLCIGNRFANGGHVLLRREAVRLAGPPLAHLRFGADWEYWVRLALLGPYAAAPGPDPVLFVRRRPGRACERLARDPSALAPAIAAIFGNPLLVERLGPERCAALRRRAEAEAAWILGRELIRQGARGAGLRRLRASVAAAPSPKRALLLAAAHLLPLLPTGLRSPFEARAG
ncbi:glycosyltransferase family 2 protein [Crenalkalicoccus roseus]|uniref:glycosyltransferase family 2 protein n=1 Tax=Crenalkalicoccus roseus TaxID=1485588 RepID=UPI0010821992|nr:glycosyltransferase family A protein [Crenalkalicoccus roseus]